MERSPVRKGLSQQDILYSDNHLLVVNKVGGILTQPDESVAESLEDLAKDWIRQTCGKSGNVYLHAAHRIDKVVSGAVIFARTDKALSRLNDAMRHGKVQRTYHAITEGIPENEKGTFKDGIRHS